MPIHKNNPENKILILSINKDYSTGEIIEWLLAWKISFVRINEDEPLNIIKIDKEEVIFLHQGEIYNINEFTGVWYRRGVITLESNNTSDYIKRENKEIIHSLYHRLLKFKHINTFFNSHINKVIVLNYNNLERVKLPAYTITEYKSNALDFFNRNKNDEIISKPVMAPFSKIVDNTFYMAYTSKISLEDIKKLTDKFVPTFFQVYIKKRFEIRTFYLKGKFYSMCIFSQKNNRTEIDFRNYDKQKPNRQSPFKLPTFIENDLIRILSDFKLDCASLDLIFTGEDFYLLDINPIGQFGMVSYPCNYNLEQKIANYLCTHDQ